MINNTTHTTNTMSAITNRVVNNTYDAETEMRPRHWSDGIETRPR